MGMRHIAAVWAFLLAGGCPAAAQSPQAAVDPDNQATVKMATPLFSSMSPQSAILKNLAQGEVVSVAFSVFSPDGEWCQLSAGGYVPCASLERNLSSRTMKWQTLPPPEPPEMAVTDVQAKELGLAYQNRSGRFRLGDIKGISRAFRGEFSRPLPLSAYGATAVHRYLGLDHRNGVDVAVHPDQPEGMWLRRYLIAHGMPYYAFTHAIRGKATAAHIHIGPASARIRRVPPKTARRTDQHISF